MALTYAEARAACVARWGEPAWESAADWRDDAWWPAPGVADDGAMVDGVALTRGASGLHLRAGYGSARDLWPIASAAELTAALDAADAFLRDATKGP